MSEGTLLSGDTNGNEVDFTQQNTRWNHGWTRIMYLSPTVDLIPGEWYDVIINEGINSITNTTSDQPHSFRFQVECSPSNSGNCPELGEIPQAELTPTTNEQESTPKQENGKGCTTIHAIPFSSGIYFFAVLWLRQGRKRSSSSFEE